MHQYMRAGMVAGVVGLLGVVAAAHNAEAKGMYYGGSGCWVCANRTSNGSGSCYGGEANGMDSCSNPCYGTVYTCAVV